MDIVLYVIMITVALLSFWSAWATWQNTRAIDSILKSLDEIVNVYIYLQNQIDSSKNNDIKKITPAD